MKYLIDTHILIWHAQDNEKLSPTSIDIIDNMANEIFVSAVSIWEIAIKKNLGKLEYPDSFLRMEYDLIANLFELLPLKFSHNELFSKLPQHHKDPFDRMLIAQAMAEDLTIITQDDKFRAYEPDVKIIWN
jgi:PIN domain nuclease of toxin-antitoxin system